MCSRIHGYSIGIKLIFECDTLDERNWVHDFGGLAEFKKWSEHMFDHVWLIAEDDPHLEIFLTLPTEIADIRIVPAVGCERFAEMAYNKMAEILQDQLRRGELLNPTVRVKSVEVFEHDANSAIYEG
jgi:6-pyruvoyltetrahydropterin/6-carboxytetrahydropterin synthase